MSGWLRWVALCALTLVGGADWPNWRGPTGNGVAPPGQYPVRWSATENVLWKLPLPGRGASTPIVAGDRIYLTYGQDGQNVIAAVGLDGRRIWQTEVGAERKGKHKKASGSNSSAISDGERVFVYFKSGDLACLDAQGKILWRHNLQQEYGEDTLWWDLGTSPVLTSRHLVVAVMQTGPSYLVAFDRETGKLAWKQDRQLEAPVEAAQSYTTPVVGRDAEGHERIYVVGADHITAHEATTGAELWRVGGLNPEKNGFFRSIASPVLSDEILIAPYARGTTITAVRLGGKGDVTASHIAWFKNDLGSDVPTPAVHGGRVYVCTDRGEVACLNAATGAEIWRHQVEKSRQPFSASPIVAGGHVYVTREDGKTIVLREGDRPDVVAVNELAGEYIVATPIFVDGRILIRAYDNLYCIGQ
ncbi:MAG: PQQ-binding-like beta-propeller repeat protein [Pirellulaceae bacterium]